MMALRIFLFQHFYLHKQRKTIFFCHLFPISICERAFNCPEEIQAGLIAGLSHRYKSFGRAVGLQLDFRGDSSGRKHFLRMPAKVSELAYRFI